MKHLLVIALLSFSNFAFALQEQADRNCLIVLREAALKNCVNGRCTMQITVDVKEDWARYTPYMLFKTQGAPENHILSDFGAVGVVKPGYVRFVSLSPTRFVTAMAPTEIIPYLYTSFGNYYDHNVNQDLFSNYVITPDVPYLASQSVCN
ncbi:hypothetical protein [Bdellovibrio sp. NC01]|uniref:hypothetical protein n=1 Tax=Bdellovibrio sp. NC01 TaxID=2220073 RepID=UPI001158FC03|nr:hypothetical protein [Bdellovibrio sp. NC01]QDK38195.1 hypothetical protein DOE51_11675 [Bdellovibrio sp. NC01]